MEGKDELVREHDEPVFVAPVHADAARTKRDDLDPEDFLRALLRISPEDAAQARDDAARAAKGQDDTDPEDKAGT